MIEHFKKYGHIWVLVAAFLVLGGWLVWLWYGKQPVVARAYQVTAPAKPVADVAKVDHPAPPRLRVIPKAAAVKRLELPPEVANDARQQVVDTAEIPPVVDGATTVTVIDVTTGETRTMVKANPRPLFAFLRTGAAGVRYGITSHGDQQATLFVRQDVLRIGNVHLSALAEARTIQTKGTREAALAAEVSYRW